MDARKWVWSFQKAYDESRDYAWEELHGCVLCSDAGCVFCEEVPHPARKIPLTVVSPSPVPAPHAEDLEAMLVRIRAYQAESKEKEKDIEDRYFQANKPYIIQQLTYETHSRNHGRLHS